MRARVYRDRWEVTRFGDPERVYVHRWVAEVGGMACEFGSQPAALDFACSMLGMMQRFENAYQRLFSE